MLTSIILHPVITALVVVGLLITGVLVILLVVSTRKRTPSKPRSSTTTATATAPTGSAATAPAVPKGDPWHKQYANHLKYGGAILGVIVLTILLEIWWPDSAAEFKPEWLKLAGILAVITLVFFLFSRGGWAALTGLALALGLIFVVGGSIHDRNAVNVVQQEKKFLAQFKDTTFTVVATQKDSATVEIKRCYKVDWTSADSANTLLSVVRRGESKFGIFKPKPGIDSVSIEIHRYPDPDVMKNGQVRTQCAPVFHIHLSNYFRS